MRQDVVGDHQIGGAMTYGDFHRGFGAEQADFGGDAGVDGGVGGVDRRLDPQHVDTGLLELEQQGAIVGSDLYDQGVLSRRRRLRMLSV